MEIDGQAYVVATQYSVNGEVRVYRVDDDGTATLFQTSQNSEVFQPGRPTP